MAYKIVTDKNYVFIELSGKVSQQEMLKAIADASIELEDKSILMVNSKALSIPFNLYEKHSFFVALNELKVNKNIHIITVTNFINEEHNLLEMVAKNRGWKLKNCLYIEQAERLIEKIIQPVLLSPKDRL